MIEIVYDKPGFIQVIYNPERDFMLFDWTNFLVTLDEIQELHARALDRAKAKGCYYYIAQTAQVRTVLREEVVTWWGDVWVPKLVEAGLKAIVTVVPQSALATTSTRAWQAEVVNGIVMKNVKSFVEALAEIQTLQRHRK